MAHEDHDALYAQLASRGVSRRDFLKYCGSIAALLGLSEAYVPQIAVGGRHWVLSSSRRSGSTAAAAQAAPSPWPRLDYPTWPRSSSTSCR